MRHFGVVARGVRLPVITPGTDLVTLVTETLFKALTEEKIAVKDGDIIGITESIVARSQSNYASSAAITKDVQTKLGGGTIGVIFPIMSRNRFLGILKAIAKAADKVIVQLSYPRDEVGNALCDIDAIESRGINPIKDVFLESEFRELIAEPLLHPFTDIDYPALYKNVAPNIEIIFANQVEAILSYTHKVIVADIHSRQRTKRLLKEKGARIVLGLDELLTRSVDGSGYNETYGVLGSNFASDDKLKLFPRDGQRIVDAISQKFYEKYRCHVEVLIYGDGAFKDPVGHIWELADPVVAPFYTSGLAGVPHELKFKYLSDTKFANLSSEAASVAMKAYIKDKQEQKIDASSSLGTTPRRIRDLVGSLCDLTSGSGDKGTPVIYISGYFDKYHDE